MPLRRSVLARMAGEKARRPQFVRIAKLLGLATSEIYHPGFGLRRDCRLTTWPRQIVERRDRTMSQRPFNTALDSLMVHPRSLCHRKEGRVFLIGEQHARPLDPPCRLASRTCNHAQCRHILLANRQFHRLPPRRHDLNPRLRITQQG